MWEHHERVRYTIEWSYMIRQPVCKYLVYTLQAAAEDRWVVLCSLVRVIIARWVGAMGCRDFVRWGKNRTKLKSRERHFYVARMVLCIYVRGTAVSVDRRTLEDENSRVEHTLTHTHTHDVKKGWVLYDVVWCVELAYIDWGWGIRTNTTYIALNERYLPTHGKGRKYRKSPSPGRPRNIILWMWASKLDL